MSEPFSEQMNRMADEMGISMYQRFSLSEATLFLRCPMAELEKLIKSRRISFVQLTAEQVEFFGFQLIEYLAEQVVTRKTPLTSVGENISDRILNAKDVQELTGLSRTSIWRLERKGEFPTRVALTLGRVGWRYLEIEKWLNNR